MLNIKYFIFNPLQVNTYLLWNEKGAGVLIDPGCYDGQEQKELETYLTREKITPKAVWLTHGHLDHVYGVAALVRKYSLPVLMAPEEKPILSWGAGMARSFGIEVPDVDFPFLPLSDGQLLPFPEDDSGACFRVISTPGHTPGGVCFYAERDKVLFSGDTLFAGSIGRTDHPAGDYDQLILSLMDKLMELPGDVDVLPGHGYRTSIAYERMNNPFLEPFNEPDEEGMENT